MKQISQRDDNSSCRLLICPSRPIAYRSQTPAVERGCSATLIPSWAVDISFKNDTTIVLLFGVSFIVSPASNVSTETVFVNLLRSPRIDSKPGGSVRQPYSTYWSARLDYTLTGGIDSLKSIPGLLECLQIRLNVYDGKEHVENIRQVSSRKKGLNLNERI
jgi:hypothetical protein